MMKLGIKTGLLGNPLTDLEISKPDFTEIWFLANNISQYDDLFRYLKKALIPSGLHFWGSVSANFLANISYPDQKLHDESIKLIKNTIDCAAKNNCVYVNLHPGNAMLVNADFTQKPTKFMALGKQVPFRIAFEILLKSITELADYANQRNVKICLESVPLNCYSIGNDGKMDRMHYSYFAEIPLNIFSDIFNIPNLYFANDLGHTAANFISADRTQILNNLEQITRKMLDQTRLLHIAYILPPYNGTDYHGSLYDREFQTDAAIPNFKEMKELLKLFEPRDDVYALVEPNKDHPGNFKFLKTLVNEI